jgi:hypothetical protein
MAAKHEGMRERGCGKEAEVSATKVGNSVACEKAAETGRKSEPRRDIG